MSRDTHCATCHELVFLKLYLAFFSNTTCFNINLETIFNRFGNVFFYIYKCQNKIFNLTHL